MNQEEIKNCVVIRNVLKNKQSELVKMQKDIFKICEDPLLIDEYLADYKKRLFNLDFHKDNPYFARIKFVEKSDDTKYDIYISKLGFYKINDDISVVDWRSPVCDLYYNGTVGDTKYRVDENEINAFLNLKRQINFENGQVSDVYDFDDQISNDELLKPYLTKHADNRLKNIVSTIQKEQNTIIRYPFHRNLIVQGVAGSGKTTVALHRLSYLLYNYKKNFKPYQYMILSPNKVFIDYVSSILPELDAQDVVNSGLEQLTKDLLNCDIKILNKNSQKDFLDKNKISDAYLKTKTGKEYLSAIDKFVQDFENQNFLKPLVIKDIKILDFKDIQKIYAVTDGRNCEEKFDLLCKKVSMYLQNNFDKRYQILSDLQKQHIISFSQKADLNNILEKGCEKYFKKNYNGKTNILALYKNFVENIQNYCDSKNIAELKKYTLANLNKKIISYDDIGGILYLYSKIKNAPEKYADVRNIFVDEAQDLSIVTFVALSKIFWQSYFSIFGDLAQGMYSYQSICDWQELNLAFENANYLLLDKSYRTTKEIMDNANLTLEKLAMPLAQNVLRHGEKVEFVDCPKQKLCQVTNTWLENLENKGFKTIAVIFKNDEELDTFCKSNRQIVKIDENTETYNSPVVALTVKTAKGLEFDSVIIFNAKSYNLQNPLDLKEFFVAQTRALHKLVVLSEI